PHVGGGFGPKNPFYPEELAVPAAARLLGCPIKWVEDRRESFTATNHEREQDWEVEAAVSAQGRLLAIRGHFRHDHGAATPSGLSLPQNATTNLLGPYVLPALRLEVSACLTNMVAATSTRGAGRPQGTYVTARLPDRTAATPLGLGAYASRQAVTAGNAVHLAARMVADKARQAAAAMLEVSPDDLELAEGAVRVKGSDLKRTLGEIAHALQGMAGFSLPANLTPGFEATTNYQP